MSELAIYVSGLASLVPPGSERSGSGGLEVGEDPDPIQARSVL